MNAEEARDVLFKELIVSNEPLSMLGATEDKHRPRTCWRSFSGVALALDPLPQKKTKKEEGGVAIMLFTACPADWIDLRRVRALVPEAEHVPIRRLRTGPIYAAAAPGSGIAIARGQPGTFGALVKDKTTGSKYLLSCNHVIANHNSAPAGTPISEVSSGGSWSSSAPVIGHLDRSHPIDFTSGVVNRVDAALAIPVAGKVVSKVPKIYISPAPITPPPPLNVHKIGWATTLGVGSLAFWASGLTVTYATGATAIFDGQLGISTISAKMPFALRGDSGAVVLDGANYAVGLVFAVPSTGGIAFANPIDDVLNGVTGWNLDFV